MADEVAIKANKERKELKCENGKLVLVNPEPLKFTDEKIIFKRNQKIKESLLNETNNEIDILYDKIESDEATDEGVTMLKKWKLYRISLKKLDASDINVIFQQNQN